MTALGSDKILALDLGTRCGYAVLQGRHRVDSGRWSLLSSRKGRHRAERWLNFRARVRSLVVEVRPDVIAYERVRRHVGTSAAHVYGGWLASIEELDLEWSTAGVSIEIMAIEVGTWKKAAVGNGSATKIEVAKAMRRRFRYKPATEDESDALAIAEAARLMRTGAYP